MKCYGCRKEIPGLEVSTSMEITLSKMREPSIWCDDCDPWKGDKKDVCLTDFMDIGRDDEL